MIRAEIHSTDMAMSAKFDATPFFDTAGDQAILDLVRAGFGGCFGADAVARHVENLAGYEEVGSVIDHGRAEGGWDKLDCSVHAPDAIAWLQENRPHAHGLVMGKLTPETRAMVISDDSPVWDRDEAWTGDYCQHVAPAPRM